jgi:hypothetical protein
MLTGAMYGAIVWGYAERFCALFQRDLTREEIADMREVLANKMRVYETRYRINDRIP